MYIMKHHQDSSLEQYRGQQITSVNEKNEQNGMESISRGSARLVMFTFDNISGNQNKFIVIQFLWEQKLVVISAA